MHPYLKQVRIVEMTEDTYWIKTVLRKLYKLHLEDTTFTGHYWDLSWDNYIDDIENRANCEREIKALNALTNADVIDLGMMENDFPQRDTEHAARLSGAALHFDRIPIITDFDFDKFTRYCAAIGFNPSENNLFAELSFESIVPLVVIDGRRYRLNPLKDGSAVFKAIEYCYKSDRSVNIDELKKEVNTNITNINQLLKAGPFDKDSGPLSCFVEVTPKTIKLLRTADLTESQLGLIKSKSVRKN